MMSERQLGGYPTCRYQATNNETSQLGRTTDLSILLMEAQAI